MTIQPDEQRLELRWREYQLGIDLYKFYLDLVVKVIGGYFAISGGILSFYFTRSHLPAARWALALPCAVSFALALLFRWGAGLWQIVRENTFKLADELELSSVFELGALEMLLNGSAALFVVAGIAMLIVILLGI